MEWLLYIGAAVFSALSLWFAKYFIDRDFPAWWKEICGVRWRKLSPFNWDTDYFSGAPIALKITTVFICMILGVVYFIWPLLFFVEMSQVKILGQKTPIIYLLVFWGVFYTFCLWRNGYKQGRASNTETIRSLVIGLGYLTKAWREGKDPRTEIEKADNMLRAISDQELIVKNTLIELELE